MMLMDGEGCWQQRAAGVLWPCSCSISVPCTRERMYCYLQPHKASGPKHWSLLLSSAQMKNKLESVGDAGAKYWRMYWYWQIHFFLFLSVAVLSKPVQNGYTPAKENEIISPCSTETKRQWAAVEGLERGERGPCTADTTQRQQKTLGFLVLVFFSVCQYCSVQVWYILLMARTNWSCDPGNPAAEFRVWEATAGLEGSAVPGTCVTRGCANFNHAACQAVLLPPMLYQTYAI